jgi:hypothetical protein
VRHEATDQAPGQASGCIRGQGAEQSAALGHPRKAPLEDPDRESATAEVADDQGQKSAIGGDVRAHHHPGQACTHPDTDQRSNQGGRQMENDERVASDRRRR